MQEQINHVVAQNNYKISTFSLLYPKFFIRLDMAKGKFESFSLRPCLVLKKMGRKSTLTGPYMGEIQNPICLHFFYGARNMLWAPPNQSPGPATVELLVSSSLR